MKYEIDASASDDYGDYATVRIYFDDQSWLEIDAADAWDINQPRDETQPYGQGAAITAHHADGTEEIVWAGRVMPKWFADRKAKSAR